MADEKNDPPRADEGAGTPAPKSVDRSGGASSKPGAEPSPKAPAGGEAIQGEPAKPVAATPPNPIAPAKPPASPAVPGAPAKPVAVPGAPAKPAGAVPAKPAAAAAPRPPAGPKAPIKPDPWTSPLLDKLNKKFPGAVTEPVTFRNQPSLNIAKEHLVAICDFLKGTDGGAYTLLTDETAVDFPKREKRFDIVYHLYSFEANNRLRLRVQVAAGEKVPSVVGVWPTANWQEREIFDMFGVEFEGHPDLRRILLPDEWTGHPLRKDYDILKQDVDWVKKNLGIESGQ